MKKTLTYLLIFGILFISSCTKVDEADQKNVGTLTYPVASFSFSGNEGPSPAVVTFQNSSEYSDQWLWTFHNGSTSSAFEPSFTYYNNTTEDKTFLVTLEVTDSGSGLTNTRSKSVIVHPAN